MNNPRNRKSITGVCINCARDFPYKIYGEGRAKHYNRKQKFCTKVCADAWQTKGWGTDKNGYQVQYRSDGNGKRVWAMQHRKIMEEFLKRPLRPDETVHHKNGDRSDNRIENLELWTSRHGKGQRVADKIAFCRSLLNQYECDAPYYSPSDAIRGISGLV